MVVEIVSPTGRVVGKVSSLESAQRFANAQTAYPWFTIRTTSRNLGKVYRAS